MADQQHLRQAVLQAVGQKTHRRLIPLSPGASAPADAGPLSASLETQVLELRLERAGSGDAKFTLRIRAKARLVRASDGVVLREQPYEYRSGQAMFIDWTRNDGFAGVARTGYLQIAEDLARDFFPSVDTKPIVLGRGHPEPRLRTIPTTNSRDEVPARTIQAPVTPAFGPAGSPSASASSAPDSPTTPTPSASPFALNAVIETAPRFANRPADEDPAAPSSLASRHSKPKAPTQDEEDSAIRTDTEWKLDGLEEDRNAVVQAAACLAAVPYGLWETTVGAVREGSNQRFEAVSGRFQEVVQNLKPQQVVAGELARLLQRPASKADSETGLRLAASSAPDPSLAAASESPAVERQDPTGVLVRTGGAAAVEIRVTNVELDRKSGFRGHVALRLEAQATLLRLSDGQELCSWPLQYLGVQRRLEDWSAKVWISFREELVQGCREMAGALAGELVSRGAVSASPAAVSQAP